MSWVEHDGAQVLDDGEQHQDVVEKDRDDGLVQNGEQDRGDAELEQGDGDLNLVREDDVV